jgi:hypothetical protein
MSALIEIYNSQDSWEKRSPDLSQGSVIGYVLAAVVKKGDTGEITLERVISVSADSFEDNELSESVVKTIERKLNEAFPDPNKPEPSKLWVPA